MKTIIILPTFNEIDNIEAMIRTLQIKFSSIKDFDMEILVVDDHSPDGTVNVVKNLQYEFSNLHFIQNENRGLGNAYIKGIKY